jgi:hypothetical protein
MPISLEQDPTAGRRPRHRAVVALLLTVLVAGASVTTDAGAATRLRRSTAPAPTTTTTRWTTAARVTTTTEAATTTTRRATTTTIAPTTTTSTTPSAPALAPGVLRRAALRITIDTTSDWAQLDLPGISAGHLVAAAAGSSDMVPMQSGVVVRGVAGVRRSMSVDVVTEVPSALTSGWATLQQGALGSTSVVVENRTAAPVQVLSMATPPGGTSTVAISIDKLMGPVQLQWKRADSARHVLAFTYPWFDESASTDPRLSVHPTQRWRSWDPDDALRASQLARQNGIDGFVMSWAGAAKHGLALYQTLAAAQATGGTATILLETVEAGSAAVAEQWIAEALQQSSSPAFLRLGGVPVVFVFDGGRLTSTEWAQISQHLAAAGTPVRLVADTWDGQRGATTGMYRYNALLQTETDPMTGTELTDWNQTISRALRARATLGSGDPGLVVATVQPGWDDHLVRGADRLVVGRAGTATYDATWSAALAAEADWVVVTSWNEWFEGTGIAPSAEYGSTALAATGPWALRFRG